jgi:hypothetical protein
VVLEMNEKLLEAHKKVVQSKLSREVARTILDGSSSYQPDQGEHQMTTSGLAGRPIGGGSKRWGPHLEGIPEESRANTLSHGRSKEAAGRSGETTPIEGEEEEEDRKEGSSSSSGAGQDKQDQSAATSSSSSSSSSSSQMKKLSTSDPQSLDSGILTRSSSISDISENQTDIVTSNEFDTDNETVDVADSDNGESDETDSDTYAAEGPGSDAGRNSQLTDRPEAAAAFPQHEAFLRYQNRRQKKDFVSELYHTAVAKVPKVIPSDTESIYSSQSTIRRDFEYDSLDINSNARYKDIYTNPNMAAKRSRADSSGLQDPSVFRSAAATDRDDYEIVNVKSKENAAKAVIGSRGDKVAEMYVNNEYDASTLNSTMEYEEEEEEGDQPSHEYSAGEKMMISISGDNESVYSNKLLISVNGGHQARGGGLQFSSPAKHFDPDTLERGSALTSAASAAGGGQKFKIAADVRTRPTEPMSVPSGWARRRETAPPAAGQVANKSSFYLFREEEDLVTSDVTAGQQLLYRTAVESAPAVVVSSRPSLPPKTRLTPKLPPKPLQKGKVVPRPLPPPPPPFPN